MIFFILLLYIVVDHYLFPKGLFIANKTDICMLDIRVITSLSHEPKCLPVKPKSVRLLATSALDNRLYFTDSGFLYSFNFVTNKTSSHTRVGKVAGTKYYTDIANSNCYYHTDKA